MDLLATVFKILIPIFSVFGIVLTPFLLVIIYFVLFILIDFYYHIYVKKFKIIKLEKDYIIEKKKPGFFRRIFLDFPKQFTLDLLNHDPYEFKESGLQMFVGEQGSGKSIALVVLLIRLKAQYPKCIIRTNMAYSYEDNELKTWQDLVNNNNGIYGQIEVIDEIQTWWSSKDSGKMSAEMLENICQQRKQRKVLFGTAQVFSKISKEIREQTSVVYCPKTILGCLTIVRVTKPKYWNNDKQEFTKFHKTYFFVHNKELREIYDTYKVISRFKEVGKNDRISQSDDIVINIKN